MPRKPCRCELCVGAYQPRFKHVQTYRTWLINGTTAHTSSTAALLHTSIAAPFAAPLILSQDNVAATRCLGSLDGCSQNGKWVVSITLI